MNIPFAVDLVTYDTKAARRMAKARRRKLFGPKPKLPVEARALPMARPLGAVVLRLWREGADTRAIAERLNEREAAVYNALARAREAGVAA